MMNMHGIGVGAMGVSPMQMQQQQPSPQMAPNQQIMAQPNPQIVPQERIDNISKVKTLVGPLRESLGATLKSAAMLLNNNNQTDCGLIKTVDTPPRFDKHLEEFYSICDQMELHLKTAQAAIKQNASSQHYLPIPVAATRLEPSQNQQDNSLSYQQFLELVKIQVNYANEIKDTLSQAAQLQGIGVFGVGLNNP